MKNALVVCVMIIGSFIMFTCSEAPELAGPNPPAPPGPKLELTNEERMAVLKEVSDMVKTLGDLKQDAARQVLAAWLKSRPEFSDAGAGDGNVWASFHDGRVIIIVPDWLKAGEDDGGRAANELMGGRFGEERNDARTHEIPEANNVMLFNGLGSAFIDDRQFIKDLFGRSHTKYAVYTQEASVDNLKEVRDAGVFYIFTHGGTAYVTTQPSTNARFALWTTDTASLQNEEKFLPELNSGMLYYMHAVDDAPDKDEWHYAITSSFVRHHSFMNFAADAFIYIDACNGMSEAAGEFRTSMINEARNHRATYIGWTAPTSTDAGIPAHRYIFDRLLGTHDQSVPMEEPVQRPFDWPLIFDDLANFNLGTSRYGGKLDFLSIFTTQPMLTPSIEYVWMADNESTMSIKGLFGIQPADGTVTVDGIPASIKIWTPYLIMAEIPTKGKGSSGDVIVSVRGNESNKVPLSEWTIPFTLAIDEFGISTEVNLQLKIRADVHDYRTKPGEAPRKERLEAAGTPVGSGGLVNAASTGTYSVGGTRQVHCTVADCSIRDTESVTNKTGNLPFNPFGSGLGFSATHRWASDMTSIYIQFVATIPNVSGDMELYGLCPDGDPVTIRNNTSRPMGGGIPFENMVEVQIKLDENYKVQHGRITTERIIEWGRCDASSKIVTEFIWSDATPSSPPKDDTDARSGHDK